MQPPADPGRFFHPFSLTHVLVVLICAALIAAAVALGRRFRDTPRERPLSRSLGVFCLFTLIASVYFTVRPATFTIDEGLPIHLCDLTLLAATLSFFTHSRLAKTLCYFWGIGLSSQGFFTPVLLTGPAHVGFYLFWAAHLANVGAGVYHLAVHRYRPTARDWFIACACTLAWAALAIAVNISFDVNYGFLGNTLTQHQTLIHYLGPWPFRLFALAAIVFTLFALMLLPFLRRAPSQPRRT